MRFVYYNIWLPWSAKVDSTPIDHIKEWENAYKTHKAKNKKNKNGLKNKTVVTIIFDGKLWSYKWAYGYESLERMPIWEYPKIGPWFEIMTSVDTDLRSGRWLETGRWSESIIYIRISAVDHDFEPWCYLTKEYKTKSWCYSANHATLRSKSKDSFAQNQDNVSTWIDMSTCELLY